MTRFRTGSSRWRKWSVLVLAALAARMALPAAHGLEIRRLEQGSTAAVLGDAAAVAVAHASEGAPAHDPATCPVCQSLLRAGSAALAPASRLDTVFEAEAPPSESPTPVRASAPGRAHPPRAPPAFLLG